MTVLYTYRCAACSHRGEVRHDGDSHDGDTATCTVCNAAVTLEWDGGVTVAHMPIGEEEGAHVIDKETMRQYAELCIEVSSGNIYADLGTPAADAMLAKAQCARGRRSH